MILGTQPVAGRGFRGSPPPLLGGNPGTLDRCYWERRKISARFPNAGQDGT